MTQTLTVVGLMPLLLRRKRLLLFSGIITAALAFGASRILPLEYTSEGALIVSREPTSHSESSGPSILTEVDVLQSKGLIRRGMEEYKLADVPGLQPRLRLPASFIDAIAAGKNQLLAMLRSFTHSPPSDPADDTDRLVTYIQKHLQVESKEKSSVISIGFTAGTADAAATVVNAIMGIYLKATDAARDAQVAKIEKWITGQLALHNRDIAVAEGRLTDYVGSHNLTEVQGSLTTAIQLSKDQEELIHAHEDYAKAMAALDSVQKNGAVATSATIGDKSVQVLKELETRIGAQLSTLTSYDPRREALQNQLVSVRSQLGSQKELVFASLNREVQIARARVEALETTVKSESATAQVSSVAGAKLKQLTNDLEAKRSLYVSFLTQASQMRIAVMQQPTAQQLFQGLPPERPAHAFGAISLILGFVAGVVGAASTVLFRATTADKISSRFEVAKVTGLTVFGSLPEVRTRDGNISTPRQTASLITETFRAMWLTMRPEPGHGTTVLITSSEVGEGKTTIACAVARRFADDGHRVLLVDADLRRHRLSAALGLRSIDPERSLEAVIDGEISLSDAALFATSGLDCLISNGLTDNPIRVLSSSQFAKFLDTSTQAYDFVILDSPPVLRVADAVLLATLCQHVIFIVQAGRLSNTMIDEAIRRFAKDDRDKILPMMNRVPARSLEGSYGGYAP